MKPDYDNWKEAEGHMTNLDFSIDEGLAEELKKGSCYAQHAAWNFCGYVWWDEKQFCEEVWQYHEPQEIIVADSLEEIMERVNDKYGDD